MYAPRRREKSTYYMSRPFLINNEKHATYFWENRIQKYSRETGHRQEKNRLHNICDNVFQILIKRTLCNLIHFSVLFTNVSIICLCCVRHGFLQTWNWRFLSRTTQGGLSQFTCTVVLIVSSKVWPSLEPDEYSAGAHFQNSFYRIALKLFSECQIQSLFWMLSWAGMKYDFDDIKVISIVFKLSKTTLTQTKSKSMHFV